MAEGRPQTGGDGSGGAGERRERPVGVREVLLVAAAVVVTVLAAAAVTSLLPPEARSVVTDTPLAIVVLVGVTAVVLFRVARGSGG
ncbi:MAG TPA: hypothetical protein VNO86_01245 [Candidatus Binatia bacterium]|nr:hypothetical protein [Candidatus Binatia bacterium]